MNSGATPTTGRTFRENHEVKEKTCYLAVIDGTNVVSARYPLVQREKESYPKVTHSFSTCGNDQGVALTSDRGCPKWEVESGEREGTDEQNVR